MSFIREGLRIAKVFTGPALIGAALASCGNDDVSLNPVDCSGETQDTHIELFLPIKQSVEIFGKKIETLKQGELTIEDSDRADLTSPAKLAEDWDTSGLNDSDARVTIYPVPTTVNGTEGTLLSMDWSCD